MQARIPISASLVVLLLAAIVTAADLPKTIPSGACKTPPTIDGVINADEWKEARSYEFDLNTIAFKTMTTEKWKCKLWVMNSANGLYVALQVPDPTFNKSTSPFDLDAAILAFCRGKELAAGDDRKTIAHDMYLDKHLLQANKDADDKKQDGTGRMVHNKGVATFEWAMPLDSGDKEDLQAKPGDKVRFNVAYFDAFQFDLKDTRAGGAYGTLDKADDWGTLELAADVKDDGGAAFKGPGWVETLFKSFSPGPAKRLKVIDSVYLPGQAIVRVSAEFVYLDPQGKEKTAKAKIYLPESARDGKTKFPLYFNAGYEANDGGAAGLIRSGFVVATPAALEANPLIRTANPDLALLHMMRALPFVDDAKVVIGGGSAGGYATLMLAAETFPLAGAVPDVPPVNWGYNGAFFFKQKDAVTALGDDKKPRLPVLASVGVALADAPKLYGDDYGDKVWFAHSPLAHFPTITCPVLVTWTTADMLVPIDQVSKEWVRPFDEKAYPSGFTTNPEKLNESKEARLRVVDVLKEKDYEVFLHKEDDIKSKVLKQGEAVKLHELPFSKTKQWSINIWDEGRPEPALGHMKYGVLWSRAEFMTHVTKEKIGVAQLTSTKLERLMDRYAGKEWLPTKLKHLDLAESERADVLRGLKTYLAGGADHIKQFSELYDKLPREKQVLEADLVRSLKGTK